MNLFNGSPETTMLLWATVLGLVQLLLATSMATKDQGLAYNLSPRDLPPPPVSVIAGRLQRAFKNFLETFPLFAAAVIFVTLAGKQTAITALGAQLYFWGRLFYVPAYASGIILIRTLCWAVSIAGLVMVLAAGFACRLTRATLDHGRELVRQMRNMEFAVPGGLRLGQQFAAHLFRQAGPGGDHGRTEPPHQTLILGGIFETICFGERHCMLFLSVEIGQSVD